MANIPILSMLKKYLKDAAPGGSLNPEWTPERTASVLSMLADVTPVIGGAKGAKEEFEKGNYPMAAFNAMSVPLDLMTGVGGTALKGGLAAIPMMVGATRSTGGAAQDVTDAFLSLRHNLSKDKLKAVTNSNTLPHPSLAVVHTDRPFTDFGSYSMVFDPKRIKPSAQNPLYARDVYTARGPETERLGERLAKDILLNEDDPNPTHLLSVLHSPKFTKGWKEYKESPLGAGVLVPNANPVSYDAYLEDTMKLLEKYGITPQDIYEGKPVPKEVIDYVQKLPSEYAELKMGRDVVPSDSVRLISGPMDKDVRSMALDLGVSFIPTKSQLRSELPNIIREFNADFAAGGLVRMQQGGKVPKQPSEYGMDKLAKLRESLGNHIPPEIADAWIKNRFNNQVVYGLPEVIENGKSRNTRYGKLRNLDVRPEKFMPPKSTPVRLVPVPEWDSLASGEYSALSGIRMPDRAPRWSSPSEQVLVHEGGHARQTRAGENPLNNKSNDESILRRISEIMTDHARKGGEGARAFTGRTHQIAEVLPEVLNFESMLPAWHRLNDTPFFKSLDNDAKATLLRQLYPLPKGVDAMVGESYE